MILKFKSELVWPALQEMMTHLNTTVGEGGDEEAIDDVFFPIVGLHLFEKFPNLLKNMMDFAEAGECFTPEAIKEMREDLKEAGSFPITHQLLDSIKELPGIEVPAPKKKKKKGKK